jgi:hypothetical protein
LETVAIFAGIPVAVIAAIVGLVYGGNARRSRRYRPGRPFEFAPVWFLAPADAEHDGDSRSRQRAVSGGNRVALGSAAAQGAGVGPAARSAQDRTGGASDHW